MPKGVWIDISAPVGPGTPVWEGDPPVVIERVLSLDCGDECTLSRAELGLHTGTHMDAPCHFLQGGASLDAMPLDAVIGPARVLAIRGGGPIEPPDLEAHRIRRGERILFRTRNSEQLCYEAPFSRDFVALSPAGAEYLATRRIRAVGIDYLSIGGFGPEGNATHRVLLKAGIWIIEGLDLRRVHPGRYDLVCLPLRIVGADGAPARAALRKRRR